MVVCALVGALAFSASAQQGGGNGGGGMGGGGNRQQMTPEQRQQFMAQMEERRAQQRADWLRQAMTGIGVADVAVQTSVINYMVEQEKTKLALREQARALAALLVKPGSTPEEIKPALQSYRDAVAAAKTKEQTGLTALDGQVKYSTNPRVETMLTLVGVLGNETTEVGGIGAIFPDSPYGNQGARGGQNGGGQNGGGRNGGGRNGGGRNGGGGQAAPQA